jgi:hypothetical protein
MPIGCDCTFHLSLAFDINFVQIRVCKTKNKIDNQTTGFNAQANEDDPGN